jgi:PAS domain S-box-containing protein
VAGNVSRDRADLPSPSADWLAGGGEMARLVRALDSASTPLGPFASWPQSLRSALSICLGSRFPIVIYWGPDLVVLYNDAYAEILGQKHPWALGRPCREVWSEIWDVIRPMLDRVLTRGDATWSEDQMLLLERRGYPEECYFSFSFSPVHGANGGVDGIFTAVIENTGRVLGERRLRTLRDLGSSLTEAKSAEEACRVAANVLADNRADVPFALLYLVDPQSRRGTLAASTAGDSGIPPAPTSFELDDTEGASAWPLASVCRSGDPVDVGTLSSPTLLLPMATAGEPLCTGVIAVGVSPRRELDQEYKGFFELIARRVAAAIAEARAYEAESRRAQALAEIDRAKTAFFSNVSHEFRTPLTLMLGPLEELKGELAHPSASLSAAHYQQIDFAHRNGLRLLKLVNTLLDFSRIEAGRVQAVYEPTDLAGITAELASVFRSAIEKAGLRLIVDCPALSEHAYVDREMWEKIVLNLVSNALKFTFEGDIEVKLRQADDHVELTVRDTGTGIPAHEVPKLFERFHRVAGAHSRTHEGSGIGLALVQELVKLHGGSVSVDSQYGKGSTFRVVVPLGHDHLPAGQIGAARNLASTALGATPFVEEALRWLPDKGPKDDQIIEDVAATQHAEATPGERARILLADDNADMRDYVRRLLASRYEVDVAADGEAALAAIARRKPDLLLADVMMPRLDGLGLLARLRADPRTKTLPIILVSARAGEEARVQGLAAGADDYVVKPFSAREMLAKVGATINVSTLRREAEQALQESERRIRQMIDHLPVGAALIDRDGQIVHDNPAFRNYVPRRITPSHEPLDRARRWPWYRPDGTIIEPQDLPDARALRGEVVHNQEFVCRPDDGPERYALVSAVPVGHDRGRALVTIIDNDAAKRAEIATQRLAAVVGSSNDAIISKDVNGIITSWNDGAERLFGYSADDAIGKPVTILIPPERQNEEVAILERIRRGERVEHYETVRQRKDGSLIDISLAVSPLKDAYGKVIGGSKIARDITDRKRAEATQKLLLRELDHRVKNTLANVQAIVQHTLRRTSDPAEFAESFAGRIQSLSRVHSLLTAETWKGAQLHALIRDQLLHGAVDETRITAWGPPVSLEPQMTVHVALMLHELGTNALKYGALSVPGGWVTIGWRVEDLDLHLRWEERGGPPPKAPVTRGFGTTLIEKCARGEGGQARMLTTADGVAWEIALQLPRPPAPSAASGSAPELVGETLHQQVPVTDKAYGKLAGKRFLVVEDEMLVALALSAGLQDADAEVVASAGSANEARAIIESQPLDGVLLDANLKGRPVDDIAAALTRRKVPFVFVTGYGRDSLPRAFATAPLLAKPFSQAQLLEAATQLVERRGKVVRLREK